MINHKKIKIKFPKPLVSPKFSTKNSDDTVAILLSGDLVCLDTNFQEGLWIISQLEKKLQRPSSKAPYQERKAFEKKFRAISSQLLVPIFNWEISLQGANECGFLKEFYPKYESFYLPFPQIEELSGAWKRYSFGSHFPVLGHKLHPMYGTYLPTRTSHLELFSTWLHQYKGSKDSAIDIGTGSGILAFLLERAGLSSIIATDINPNAVESVRREINRYRYKNINIMTSDLFENIKDKTDLIVFNPPWILGHSKSLIDQALLFEEGLFEQFFKQASQYLKQEGRLVMLHSNIGSLLFPDKAHPFEEIAKKNNFHLEQKLTRKVKPTKRKDGTRQRTKEKVEVWEFSLK